MNIDLGDDLNDYDGTPKPAKTAPKNVSAKQICVPTGLECIGDSGCLAACHRQKPQPAWHDDINTWMASDDGSMPRGTYGKLKDLEAQGFQTEENQWTHTPTNSLGVIVVPQQPFQWTAIATNAAGEPLQWTAIATNAAGEPLQWTAIATNAAGEPLQYRIEPTQDSGDK